MLSFMLRKQRESVDVNIPYKRSLSLCSVRGVLQFMESITAVVLLRLYTTKVYGKRKEERHGNGRMLNEKKGKYFARTREKRSKT